MCLSVRGYSTADIVLWVRIGMRAVFVFLGLELSDCINNDWDTF